MGEPGTDRIHIRDLQARCIVGVFEEERRARQDVIVNITLHVDLAAACASDHFDDTVDYKTIKKKVLAMLEASEYYLLERLAARIAEICLETAGVQRVEVTVDKPGALRFARSVAVEIVRERKKDGGTG